MPRACTSVKRECVELHCVLKLLQFFACPEKVTDLMSVFGLRLTIFKKKVFYLFRLGTNISEKFKFVKEQCCFL